MSYSGLDLCSIPAGTSPDGSVPDFVNPPSLQPTIIAIVTVFTTMAVIVTTGRLFVNRKSLHWADYVMLVGVILDLTTTGVILSMVKYYRHMWDTPACWFNAKYAKKLYAEDMIVGPALFFPKASIFLFYLQIFSISRPVRIGAKVGLIFAFLAYFVPTLALSYFDAPHVGQSWDHLLTSGMPEKGLPGGITVGCLSVLVDVYVFVLPMPTLLKLNLAFSKRVQLLALFGTAFMGIVASVVCLVYRVKLLGLSDSTWHQGEVAIPILVENNVAIIVGSMPAFATFLRIYVSESSFFQSLRSKLSRSRAVRSEDPVHFNSGMIPPKPEGVWKNGSSEQNFPQRTYQELTEPAILRSHASATAGDVTTAHTYPGDNNNGIYRSVGFSQVEDTPAQYSSDRLV